MGNRPAIAKNPNDDLDTTLKGGANPTAAEIQDLFGCKTFYDVLKVGQHASVEDIKSAYRRTCAQWHPDKNKMAVAALKFQSLQIIKDVLTSPDKRAYYDEHKRVEGDEPPELSEACTTQISRALHAFKGTPDEVDHIMCAYIKCEGDMQLAIEEYVMGVELDNPPEVRRVLDVVRGRISVDHSVPVFDAFQTSIDRINAAFRASGEVVPVARAAATALASAWADAIHVRATGAVLGPAAVATTRLILAPDDPGEMSDAEFEATRARMLGAMPNQSKRVEHEKRIIAFDNATRRAATAPDETRKRKRLHDIDGGGRLVGTCKKCAKRNR